MNKHLASVKKLLEKQKLNASTKLAQASITPEQKTRLDEVMAGIESALADIEAAEAEATIEQLTAVFSKASEALMAATESAIAEVQASMTAQLVKLQAQIGAGGNNLPKKFKANFSLKRALGAQKGKNFVPFSAGVDVTAWTAESEVENVEVFHPLIGVTKGFEVSGTSSTSVKIRKFEVGAGESVAVVLNHGVKPEITMVGSQSIVNVDTYAGVVVGIADEDLEDNPGEEQIIQQAALNNLGEFENTAAIALLEGASQAFSNAKFGTLAYADDKSACAAIIDQVRQALGTRQSSISFALNSSDWAKLNDLRNDNGTPIDIASVFGDVEKIVDNSLAAGKFYCWAKKFAKIRYYKTAQADWYKGLNVTKVDGKVTAVYSEWQTDEQSIRVRQRQVMYATDNTVFVKGTIAGVVTAITAEPVIMG